MSQRICTTLFVLTAFFVLLPHAATADTISTFDTSDEGWTVVSFNGLADNNYSVMGTYSPTYQSSGGNPGGYIFMPPRQNLWVAFRRFQPIGA